MRDGFPGVPEAALQNRKPETAGALLAGILDSAMDAVVSVDERMLIVLFNRAAENVFGLPAQLALGKPLSTLIPERFRSSHGAHIERFATVGVTTRRMGHGLVIYGLRSSGEEFPLEASISQLDTDEGKIFTVILRDVSDRQRAQEERAAFATAAHVLREEEKARVARELHDELAQSLTALKMDAIWVRDHLRGVQLPVRARLDEMLDTIDQTVKATRRIAADLRPLVLDDLGLAPAIEWLLSVFSQRSSVPAKAFLSPGLNLQEPYATAVFRIVQESLANVHKHARATRVEVSVHAVQEGVRLLVKDDGVGFSSSGPRKSHSLGLLGMRERVHLLKGQIHINSERGCGTSIEVFVPVPPEGFDA